MTKTAAEKTVEAAFKPRINTAEDAAVACLREEISDDEYVAYMAHFGDARVAFSDQFLNSFSHKLPVLDSEQVDNGGDVEEMHPTSDNPVVDNKPATEVKK